jgi:hypothetical protein
MGRHPDAQGGILSQACRVKAKAGQLGGWPFALFKFRIPAMLHLQTDTRPLSSETRAAGALSLCDLMVSNLAQTCVAVSSLLAAQRAGLCLAPAMAGFAEMLRAAGLTVDSLDPGSDTPATPGLHRLPPRPGQPTDLVDLALDLHGGDGALLARLELVGVPGAWDSRSLRRTLDPLIRLAQTQIVGLRGGMALLGPVMLALLERLRDFDDQAASHLVTGFLRLMAGDVPSQVEMTALRIAGLSDMPATRLTRSEAALNTVALDLLDDLHLARDPVLRPGVQPATAPADSAEAQGATPAAALVPFAQVQLMERSFAVAEDEPQARLWFRPLLGGTPDEWQPLVAQTQDGWTHIASEIIARTTDVRRAFAAMHVIRRRDIPTTEVAEIYDLHGLVWWLRDGETCPEGRLDGAEWSALNLDDALTGKPRAIEALFQLLPDPSELLDDKAHDWVQRMAQTVQVTPVMMAAAE